MARKMKVVATHAKTKREIRSKEVVLNFMPSWDFAVGEEMICFHSVQDLLL